jgi:hypothetical protein
VNLKFIFEQMLDKAVYRLREKERSEQRVEERRQKAFFRLLSRNLTTYVGICGSRVAPGV